MIDIQLAAVAGAGSSGLQHWGQGHQQQSSHASGMSEAAPGLQTAAGASSAAGNCAALLTAGLHLDHL